MTMGVLLGYGVAAQNPVDATIDTADITFWVGSGSNRAVLIVNWGDPDTAFAWGFRFNGTVTAQTMVDSVAAADPRFWTVGSPSMGGDIHYILSNGDTLSLIPASATSEGYNFWWANINGVSSGSGAGVSLSNGDVFKYGDYSIGVGWDPLGTYFLERAWLKTPTPAPAPTDTAATDTTATPTDATIDTADIQYWIGTGSNALTFVVNWADTALAWGYRFGTESVSMTTVINDLAAADPRLVFGTTGMLDDIWFIEHGDTLRITPGNYWEHSVNGLMSAGMSTTFHNGDFSRWADPAGGVAVDSFYYDGWGWFYTYAYPATIYPVSAPASEDTVENATIAPEDITYWVGEGPFEVVFAINWPDTALAWGYRFSARSTNLQNVMNDIAAADSRFSFVTGSYGIDDILFVENGDTLRKSPSSWWEHTVNGTLSNGLSQQLNDGDFSRWADPTAGVVVDSTYDTMWNYWMYTYAYPQTIYPVSAPESANDTITADEIAFWIGEGENEAIFVVNWADTALAWGYRFADDSVTLATMMDDIAAADSRFSYSGEGMVSDINFIENGDTLGVTPGSWWEHMINGQSSMGMGQWFHNGDQSRWADPVAGVAVDSFYYDGWGWIYTYVYPMPIHPVSNPHGPFCGIVGTEGCTAVALDDSRIKAWATGCTVVRGSSNLSDPDAAAVTYGEDSVGVGPASTSTLEAVSLGDGGSATLTFATPIANGEGFDFAVFENSFDDYFLELAFVEVSSDGEHFVRFPATSLTQTRTQIGGRVDATFINNLAGKYRVGYGTPFDLDELRDSAGIDINNITHVRLVDVVGSIDPQYGTYDAFGHMVNDPFPTPSYSAGFDLEGVCVLNNRQDISQAEDTELKLYPNPARSMVSMTMKAEAAGTVSIYDMAGREVMTMAVEAGTSTVRFNTEAMAEGVYMVRFGSHVEKLVVRH